MQHLLQDTKQAILLRNLYAGQEATVRTGRGTTDLFQIGKGVRQGCILSPCLFNLYAEYIMRNSGLEEAQAGIKIVGEGPGKTPSALRCLSYLISSSLTNIVLLRNLYAGQEAKVRTGLGTTDWFQTGRRIVKAVYCHPACLTYMQSTSWEMLGWMKPKLESRFQEEISITSDMQMTPALWQKAKRN